MLTAQRLLDRMLGLDMQTDADESNTSQTHEPGTLPAQQTNLMELSGLPDTVLLSVLDCLPPKQVAGTCCLVSQTMRNAALSNDLWRNRFKGLPKVSH